MGLAFILVRLWRESQQVPTPITSHNACESRVACACVDEGALGSQPVPEAPATPDAARSPLSVGPTPSPKSMARSPSTSPPKTVAPTPGMPTMPVVPEYSINGLVPTHTIVAEVRSLELPKCILRSRRALGPSTFSLQLRPPPHPPTAIGSQGRPTNTNLKGIVYIYIYI